MKTLSIILLVIIITTNVIMITLFIREHRKYHKLVEKWYDKKKTK